MSTEDVEGGPFSEATITNDTIRQIKAAIPPEYYEQLTREWTQALADAQTTEDLDPLISVLKRWRTLADAFASGRLAAAVERERQILRGEIPDSPTFTLDEIRASWEGGKA